MGPPGSAANGPKVLTLWPDKAPGEKGNIDPEHDTTKESGNLIAAKPVIRLGNVSEPTITVHRPAASKYTGTAVVVYPDGGHLSAALGSQCDKRTYPNVDAAYDVSCRLDFTVLVYPGTLA